jgi:hypothetical protein
MLGEGTGDGEVTRAAAGEEGDLERSTRGEKADASCPMVAARSATGDARIAGFSVSSNCGQKLSVMNQSAQTTLHHNLICERGGTPTPCGEG